MGEKNDGKESETNLHGLAKMVANDEVLRKRMLSSGTLFVWPSPKTTGIVNLESVAMNVRLMNMVIEIWCPQSKKMKTLFIDHVREEAMGSLKILIKMLR